MVTALQNEPVSSKGTQEGECLLTAIRWQPLPVRVSPKEAQDVKTEHQPQIAEVHMKG